MEADDGRDDRILRERLAGRSARSIARELGCGAGEIDAALDRVLPEINNKARLRAIGLDLHRLDGLLQTFYKRAIDEYDAQAGLLCVKILERRSLLLGLDTPTRIDPIQIEIAASPTPSSVDRLRAAIDRIAHRDGGGNGNGSDPTDTPH